MTEMGMEQVLQVLYAVIVMLLRLQKNELVHKMFLWKFVGNVVFLDKGA